MKDLIDWLEEYNIKYEIEIENENDRVVCEYLWLSQKNIKELPDSIGNLNCITLNLSYNNIKELPESIGNLSCNYLDLENNEIKELPDSIGNLKCERLDLSHNEIIELPNSIGNLRCDTLDLSNNLIPKSKIKYLERIEGLKYCSTDYSNNLYDIFKLCKMNLRRDKIESILV
jgi:Leucine-rich repeat (LRR) protein